jgi:hypothetical protein
MKVSFTSDIPEIDGAHLSMLMRVRDGEAEGCTSAHQCMERAPDDGKWVLY